MKKFAMAAVAAAAMTVGVAQAYTVGTFSNGVVVPNVIHNGPTDTTAVGLISQSTNVVPVFWTFFDQESNHVTDGCFPLTPKQYKSFIWADDANSGTNTAGKRGYLVFAVGTNAATTTAANACAVTNAAAQGAAGSLIAANAFQVDATGKTVAFTPVIDGPLTLAGGTNLTTMGPDSLTTVGGALNGAAAATNTISMRYFVDGAAGGNDTRVVVWSTGDQRGTHTVNMYDNAQNRKSANFALAHSELDWFDPETISGRPAGFTDGLIEWAPFAVKPADFPGVTGQDLATLGGSVFSYSVISSSGFGAVQSVLGATN